MKKIRDIRLKACYGCMYYKGCKLHLGDACKRLGGAIDPRKYK